jgi:hypothetical protein
LTQNANSVHFDSVAICSFGVRTAAEGAALDSQHIGRLAIEVDLLTALAEANRTVIT